MQGNAMKILNVRFGNAVLLGKTVEPFFSIEQGQRFEGGRMKIEPFDSLFMQVSYEFTNQDKNYSQLVPWARVDTCLFTQEKPAVDNADGTVSKVRAKKT